MTALSFILEIDYNIRKYTLGANYHIAEGDVYLMDSTTDVRKEIQAACEKYDNLYARLVQPINEMLIEINASISEETAKKIIHNLEAFDKGEKYIADCHFDESQNFMSDGIRSLQQGDLSNGALQIFGAGLNFASYASKAAGHKNVHIHEQMNEAFHLIINELK
ncbi:hypothetical protein [Paenibacillus sp. Marseille-Q4541]|uniref:hypothetical protein n=1 Tax=Paenibacillus sp. Marseille-Q4541 TaxID=2831522 RepID=UPI00201959CF|nr:hypothetical protein [Paenibacillus sp. Marseille-Q4541]